MRVSLLLVGMIAMLMVLPLTSALEFTQNTTFSNKNINFNFVQGVVVESFEIVSDGIVLNDNEKYVFIVQGGNLDVTFYGSNVIGLKASAPQDITFKITKDDKKEYLLLNGNYLIDKINVGTTEIKVSPILYKQGQVELSDTITKTIEKEEWYQKKFIEFEYNVVKDNRGVVTSETFGLSYFWTILIFILFLLMIWWLVR